MKETAQNVIRLDREGKELFMAVLRAMPDARPGHGERLDQYYKWYSSLTKEEKAALPHDTHLRLTTVLVLGDPFPEDLRQYWPEGYTVPQDSEGRGRDEW